MSREYKFMLKAALVSLLVIVLSCLLFYVVLANGGGQETCPDGGEWTKIDSGDLSLYPVAGAIEYCFKAGNWISGSIPAGGFGQEGSCKNGIQYCDLSHWSYRMGEEDVYTVDVDCTGVYVLKNGEFERYAYLWKNPEELEYYTWAEIEQTFYEPDDCDEEPPCTDCVSVCVPETVFYWVHESGCSIRQRGGPIGGQTRPFIPMQELYCCLATDEGWSGVYVNSCTEPEEYERWDSIPQFNGCTRECEF